MGSEPRFSVSSFPSTFCLTNFLGETDLLSCRFTRVTPCQRVQTLTKMYLSKKLSFSDFIRTSAHVICQPLIVAPFLTETEPMLTSVLLLHLKT